MPTAKLIFVRHGETSYNDHGQERLRGWLDVPLDDDGKAQVKAVADKLATIDAHRIFTGDLSRQFNTAHAIAQRNGATLHVDPRMRSWNLGDLQGRKLVDVQHNLNYYLQHPHDQIPNGESLSQFLIRWRGVVDKMANMSAASGKPVIGVSSHSNLLSLPHILYGTPIGNVTTGPPKPGDIMHAEFEVE